MIKGCAKYDEDAISFNLLILQMRKLELREAEQPGHGHTGSRGAVVGARSAHAPPGGSLGWTRAGTAKGPGRRRLVGRAR